MFLFSWRSYQNKQLLPEPPSPPLVNMDFYENISGIILKFYKDPGVKITFCVLWKVGGGGGIITVTMATLISLPPPPPFLPLVIHAPSPALPNNRRGREGGRGLTDGLLLMGIIFPTLPPFPFPSGGPSLPALKLK